MMRMIRNLSVALVSALILQGCNSLPEIRIIDGPVVVIDDDSSIRVLWQTNVPADSRVRFGLTTALGSDTLISEESELHEVPLMHLTPDTTWFFRVESRSDYFDGSPSSAIESLRTPPGYMETFSYEDYINTGWSLIREGEYAAAYDEFIAARNLRTYSAEANTGIGWSLLLMDIYPEDAYDAFNTALYIDDGQMDALAGRSAYYVKAERYDFALRDINTYFSADSVYVSEELPERVNRSSMLALEAYVYYRISDIEMAAAKCRLIDPEFPVREYDSSTWTVEGTVYGTYGEALLAAVYGYLALYHWVW